MILTKISLWLIVEQTSSFMRDCAWISTGRLLSKGKGKTNPFEAQNSPGEAFYIRQPGLMCLNSHVTWLQANGWKGHGDAQAQLLPLRRGWLE